MDKLISLAVDEDLTNDHVGLICHNKYDTILYSDLVNYTSLDKVLGKNQGCILLYQTKAYEGHWCCIWKNNDRTVMFFDPYGFACDSELDLATYVKEPYLTKLITKSGYKVSSNHY